jgi:hypothetical protein
MRLKLSTLPNWPQIKAEILDPGRTKSYRQIAEEYNVRDSSGALAITALLSYHSKVRGHNIFAIAREATQDFLRNEVINRYRTVYEAAQADHDAAMSRTKIGFHRGLRKDTPDPDFAAADLFLKNMAEATEKMSAFAKPETPAVNTASANNFFLGKTQVIALPKLPQTEPKLAQNGPKALIEAEKHDFELVPDEK